MFEQSVAVVCVCFAGCLFGKREDVGDFRLYGKELVSGPLDIVSNEPVHTWLVEAAEVIRARVYG